MLHTTQTQSEFHELHLSYKYTLKDVTLFFSCEFCLKKNLDFHYEVDDIFAHVDNGYIYQILIYLQ